MKSIKRLVDFPLLAFCLMSLGAQANVLKVEDYTRFDHLGEIVAKFNLEGHPFIIDYRNVSQETGSPRSGYFLLRHSSQDGNILDWYRAHMGIEEVLNHPYFKVVAFEVQGEETEINPKNGLTVVTKRGFLKETPVSIFDPDGTTVLYHLLRAHRFFQALDPNNPQLQKQHTIRLRAHRRYSEDHHFGLAPLANTSWTIPADPKGRWDTEVWLYKPEAIKRKKTKKQILSSVLGSLAGALLSGPESLLTLPLNLIPERIPPLHSAHMPTVIAHEFTHLAMDHRDYLPISEFGFDNPLSEDIANYFGSVIIGTPKMFGNIAAGDRRYIKRFSKIRRVKKAKEGWHYNWSDFVPSLLWHFRTVLEENPIPNESLPTITDFVVWRWIRLINNLTRPTDIPRTFIEALDAFRSDHPEAISERQREQILNLFEEHKCSFEHLEDRFDWYYENVGKALYKKIPITNASKGEISEECK
jgi:hypothetical protein